MFRTESKLSLAFESVMRITREAHPAEELFTGA